VFAEIGLLKFPKIDFTIRDHTSTIPIFDRFTRDDGELPQMARGLQVVSLRIRAGAPLGTLEYRLVEMI
jgi:hypothetical protein